MSLVPCGISGGIDVLQEHEQHGNSAHCAKEKQYVYNRRWVGEDSGVPVERFDMKVMGICGSPRNGNTEWMLTKVLESARAEGAETELVLLRDKDIRLCNGCMTCEVGKSGKPGACVIKDDMEPILRDMLTADAFVFGTPVYFYMLSGLLKNFMDRTIPVWPLLKGKRAAGVAVAADTVGHAIDNIRTYSGLLRFEWTGEVVAIARDPGEVAKNNEVGAMLAALGRKLAVPA